MWTIRQEGVDNMRKMRDNLRKNIIEEKAIDKRALFFDDIIEKMNKYGKTIDLLKEFRFIKNMTDEEIMAYNPTENPPEINKKKSIFDNLKLELSKKNLDNGFWVNLNNSGFEPLKYNSKIITTIKDIKKYILKDNEQQYINKKLGYINVEFTDNICRLVIVIHQINEEGKIGINKWLCMINFTEDDLKSFKLTLNEIEKFTRQVGDKLVLSNNMIGVSYKNYLVALLKKISIQYNEEPKLKIGVKRINETEAAIKNQEKTIKGKKKQILNEQEYLNTMGKIMTGESNFIDNKGKWVVATELDVKDGLNPKIRRALKKSIIEEANKIKGTNITMNF